VEYLDICLTKDAKCLLKILYDLHKKDPKGCYHADELKSFIENLSDWSVDRISAGIHELQRLNFASCTDADDMAWYIKVENPGIAYMENALKRGLLDFVSIVTKFL
jgi:hypothetical protein